MKFTQDELVNIWNKLADNIVIDRMDPTYTEDDEVRDLMSQDKITESDIYAFMAAFAESEAEGKIALEDDLEVDPWDDIEGVVAKYDAEAARKSLTEPKIKTTRKPIYKSTESVERYLHLSDLHIPFQIDEISEVIDEYANKNFNLIINGDFLDCHDISTFPKSKAVGLNNEVKMAADLLSDWSTKFKKIYLVSGNHEKRMASYIRKRISPEVVQLVEDDILAYIVNSLKLPNLIYNPGDTTNWYVQIDNVVCCHPDDYKGSTTGMLQTATHALGYFETYNKNVDVVILGHTHHLGIGVFKNKVVAESGCLCQPQDYAASGRLNYKPQANGYIEFTSRNGKVSFNDVRLRFIDESD